MRMRFARLPQGHPVSVRRICKDRLHTAVSSRQLNRLTNP